MCEEQATVNPFGRPTVIIDDFLANPDEVRDIALQCEYRPADEFPGLRAAPHTIGSAMTRVLERFVGRPIVAVHTRFQIQPAAYEPSSFIHADLCDWAAVLYLTPGHDGIPGTNFYRHRETGRDRALGRQELMFEAALRRLESMLEVAEGADRFEQLVGRFRSDRSDLNQWEVTLTVPYRYNRLLLYDARLFHRNASAWGHDQTDSRMVQSFGIDAAPDDPTQTTNEAA